MLVLQRHFLLRFIGEVGGWFLVDWTSETVVVINEYHLASATSSHVFVVQSSLEVLDERRVRVHAFNLGVEVQLGNNVSEASEQTHPGVVDEEWTSVLSDNDRLHGYSYFDVIFQITSLSLFQSEEIVLATSGGEECFLVVDRNGSTDLQRSHPYSLQTLRRHFLHPSESIVTNNPFIPACSTTQIRISFFIVGRVEVVESMDTVTIIHSGSDYSETQRIQYLVEGVIVVDS